MMERLTKLDEHGNVTDIFGGDRTLFNWTMLVNRLYDYELVGLSPEECNEAVTVERLTKTLNIIHAYEQSGLEPSEVADIVIAKNEGRLIELPCKIGGTIYRSAYEDGKAKVWEWVVVEASIHAEDDIVFTDDSGNDFTEFDIGKTVFLTRAEAEAALEAEKGASE
jgi:hypothetical protein